MQKFFREQVTPFFLLMIKLFTVFRTGLDTLIVAGAFEPEVSVVQFINAVLYVVLIDAVMTGLWFYAAYGSEGKQGQLLKMFAIVGAWALYIGMVIIGWSAHPDAPFLALMGRIAGAIALGYDTWGYISGPIRESLIKFGKWFKHQVEGPTPEEAYRHMLDDGMVRAIRGSSKLARQTISTMVVERLNRELPDAVMGALPLPSEVAGSAESTDEDLPTYVGNRQASTDAIRQAWASCRESLTAGEEFRRADIEECTNLARSRAGDVITFGMALGEVRRVGHGRYLYVPRGLPANAESKPSEIPADDSANVGRHEVF